MRCCRESQDFISRRTPGHGCRALAASGVAHPPEHLRDASGINGRASHMERLRQLLAQRPLVRTAHPTSCMHSIAASKHTTLRHLYKQKPQCDGPLCRCRSDDHRISFGARIALCPSPCCPYRFFFRLQQNALSSPFAAPLKNSAEERGKGSGNFGPPGPIRRRAKKSL
jgi:hypothetical protein